MGTPVVSLIGRAHVCRVGRSLLESVGLRRLACDGEENFVLAAQSLAADRAALDTLHADLRTTMASSPLCDERDMGERFGAALRQMWRDWVAAASSSAR